MFSGPHVKRNHDSSQAKIEDILPTLLYLIGSSVPSNIDGQIIESAIDPEYLKTHPAERREFSQKTSIEEELSTEEEEQVLQRLRSLGYMG
jgi:arylsulfatase A-like enzyme